MKRNKVVSWNITSRDQCWVFEPWHLASQKLRPNCELSHKNAATQSVMSHDVMTNSLLHTLVGCDRWRFRWWSRAFFRRGCLPSGRITWTQRSSTTTVPGTRYRRYRRIQYSSSTSRPLYYSTLTGMYVSIILYRRLWSTWVHSTVPGRLQYLYYSLLYAMPMTAVVNV